MQANAGNQTAESGYASRLLTKQTATVTKGTLTPVVSSTGTVQVAQPFAVLSSNGGWFHSIVKTNDYVKSGSILGYVDRQSVIAPVDGLVTAVIADNMVSSHYPLFTITYAGMSVNVDATKLLKTAQVGTVLHGRFQVTDADGPTDCLAVVEMADIVTTGNDDDAQTNDEEQSSNDGEPKTEQEEPRSQSRINTPSEEESPASPNEDDQADASGEDEYVPLADNEDTDKEEIQPEGESSSFQGATEGINSALLSADFTQLNRIVSVADANANSDSLQSGTVQCLLPRESEARVGQSAVSVISAPAISDALLLPITSVAGRLGTGSVLKKEGTQFTATTVKLGASDGTSIVILSGLNEGDVVSATAPNLTKSSKNDNEQGLYGGNG
ncbi:efflux RND transporter periplasmic adaptor subunit [Bifidobacterium callimiconis]|nr:efflux RND transporter periplasmic adaptor subunit [Bifidobacterium callimiconis]MBT1177705.1 efflux RND transporter periplasmic adaptor subunit [Bifidobacterium callimiconis]